MKLNKFLFVTFLVSSFAFADANQTVWGQETDSGLESSKLKGETINIPGGVEDQYTPGEYSESAKKDSSWTKKYDSNSSPLFQGNESYVKIKNEEILKSGYKKSDDQWSFSYFYDTFDYADRANIFEKTFRNDDSAKSIQSGYLSLHQKNYLARRGDADYFIMYGGSVSYNTGRGLFEDNEEFSRANFKLWVLPLDVMLGMRVNMGKVMRLTVAGGGSLVGLYQSRSDREDQAEDKRVRQVGYGYVGQGSLDFSMSQLFKNYGVRLKNNSDISDFSISFMARTVGYTNFKNSDIEITGISFGLGANFEVL
jgi:hypothetical protein